MAKIWQDERGVYVKAGGYVARPGAVVGYMHAYNMGDYGLTKGRTVKAQHIAGTPLVKVTIGGAVRYWHTGEKS